MTSNKMSINERFSHHFFERVQQRFDFGDDISVIENILRTSRKYNKHNVHLCPHSQVRAKLFNPMYDHQDFYVNVRHNIIICGDRTTGKLFNALYLDGSDGYGRSYTWM